MIVSSFVWTKHRNMTDRLICPGYYSDLLHCERAVMNICRHMSHKS